MAKRDPRHPALRGYQVARWVSKGILKARPLNDTPILVVQEAARVRLTWKVRRKKGWVSRTDRTTISQGIFLVPRWIEVLEYELERFSRLSEEELKEKGIIREGDVLYLLIYQQIEDIDHLLRQQYHILFDGRRTKAFDRFIKPQIKARKEAALQLKRRRTEQLRDIRKGKIIPLLNRLAAPKEIPDWEIEGMVHYLDNVITKLDEIIERPFVVGRKRAQRSLKAAQRQVEKGNFDLAIKRLGKALENLSWPKKT